MKVFFIGGTRVISSACLWLTVEKGIVLCLLILGQSIPLFPKTHTLLKMTFRIKQLLISYKNLKGLAKHSSANNLHLRGNK